MDYEGFFADKIDSLRAEGRYRVFAELERHAGRFPFAANHGVGVAGQSVGAAAAQRPAVSRSLATEPS